MTGEGEPRYTCAWWAVKYDLPTDQESLLALGLAAYRLARWYGLEQEKVTEGAFVVHTWPARIWAEAAGQLTGVVKTN